jgi:hypothetical protein
MPHYYFAYEGETPETEGEDLPDDDAARAVAALVSEELGHKLPVRPRISIFNADGDLVAPEGGVILDILLPKPAR